jgi:hypothetical protein
MTRPGTALCALGIALLAFAGTACAQADDTKTEWRALDFKPLIPPIVPLPPNAQVAPGGLDFTPSQSDPARITNPGNPTPMAAAHRPEPVAVAPRPTP